MPTNKDFKRLVRGRMQKTGESYTAARARLARAPRPATENVVIAPPPAKPRYAELAGMSDEKVKKATGCPWERWVNALDAVGANTWSHSEIAKYVHEKFEVPSWWTQTVTVGYERIKGLRARGQQRDGTYRASRSKIFPVPVTAVYRAFADARTRTRWLTEPDFKVLSSTRGKRVRLSSTDGVVAEVMFTAKSAKKAQVSVEMHKLSSQAEVARWKAFWTDRIAALAELLSPARASA